MKMPVRHRSGIEDELQALVEHTEAVAAALVAPADAVAFAVHASVGEVLPDGAVVSHQAHGPCQQVAGMSDGPLTIEGRAKVAAGLNELILVWALTRFALPPVLDDYRFFVYFATGHAVPVRGILGYDIEHEPIMRFDIVGGVAPKRVCQ